MKNLLLLFSLMTFSFSLVAQQPFAPIGAKWSHSKHCYNAPHYEYFTFESIGDTLVDGQLARKIEYAYHDDEGTQFIDEANLVMYGDGDKVYYHFEDTFHILYDFSAQAGDTFEIKIGAFVNYYKGGRDTDLTDSGYFRSLVDSVSSIQLNNETLRVLYLSNLPDEDFYLGWGFNTSGSNSTIIERIGNIGEAGIFGDSFLQLPLGYSPRFRCYSDNDISYKNPNYPFACDYRPVMSTTQDISTSSFEVFPNPATKSFFVKNKGQHFSQVRFQLIDFQGITILEKMTTIQSKQSIEIPTQHLPVGIYFLKIENIGSNEINNNTFTFEKVVIGR